MACKRRAMLRTTKGPRHDNQHHRDEWGDSNDGGPPQLRTDLLKLHQPAMAVFNEGSRSQVADLFEFAVDLEDQVHRLMTPPEQV
ncbi:hypothetical protein [Pseudomonas monteilii]|nr:hypothetical protein [Pseudomonas monteilii]